jgi:hypothetical protein
LRALFSLASHLGCTVAHLRATLSAQEFMQWVAWFDLKDNAANAAERDRMVAMGFELE